MWNLLDTGKQSAAANMALDSKLLAELKADSSPLIHFYDWSKESATYGYFLRPEKLINVTAAKRWGLQLARRPTGGGLIFHQFDFAFSVLIPAGFQYFSLNTLANYQFINRAVKNALKNFFEPEALHSSLLSEESLPNDPQCRYFCMAKPTRYDVMIKGRKVAGAAQRRCKAGYLHQGSIAISMPDEDFFRDVLLPDSQVLEAMQSHTFSLLGAMASSKTIAEVRRELKDQLIVHLTRAAAHTSEQPIDATCAAIEKGSA
ncbi:MAG: hypothetical protein AAF443_07510 [Chlamydiota bacterium]